MSTLPAVQVEPRQIPRRVHVIINPAAGKDQPVLRILNAAFHTAGVDWDVFITKEAGDGRRLAAESAASQVDLVAVHGGDGTVMEVASGLAGTRVPMAILPGGTANVMALELKIPNDLVAACALAVNPDSVVRAVDIGQVEGGQGKHSFLLRASTGLEAAMVEGADRDQKDRLGVFAYALSGLHALADPLAAHYRLILDGKEVQAEGLACVVANSGAIGANGVLAAYIAREIDVSDGMLDILVITRVDLPGLLSLVTSVVTGSENTSALQRWKAREVEIIADPPQSVQVDGEILDHTPIRARVNPRAVRVIVPAEVQP